MNHLKRVLTILAFLAVAACRTTPMPASVGFTPVATQTSPAQDQDGDGIEDLRERDFGSDPTKADTDADGLDDGFENSFGEFGFDLLHPSRDADADGLEDEYEKKIGIRPDSIDSDNDGWGDFDEVLNRAYGFDPLKPTTDQDFDGLADDLERRIKSGPDNPDTNADGITDFAAHAAGINPAGAKGPFGELVGITYSDAMRAALGSIRKGGSFPTDLAEELPYPKVTQRTVAAGKLKPSAALMQRSAYNPHHSPGIYPSYGEIVARLFGVAGKFNGVAGPDIVRLFVWSAPTVDCCIPREGSNKPGRRIYALKVSSHPEINDPKKTEVLLMGLHHARELITATFPLDLLDRLTQGYGGPDPAITKLVDNFEIWFIPVVNPNGYDRVILEKLDWRKNTRRVSTSQPETVAGVDVNRNYDFDHASTVPVNTLSMLSVDGRFSNGLTLVGVPALDPNSFQYPGPAPFTEVESQAVAGLAHNQFLTKTRDEVDGLVCALSWHSFTGLVLHPFQHPPNLPLSPANRAVLGQLADKFAGPTGYLNVRDGFANLSTANGDIFDGYPVYGDANDWLFYDGHTRGIAIEAYSAAEGQHGNYYPTDPTQRDAVSAHNVNGALEFIRACR